MPEVQQTTVHHLLQQEWSADAARSARDGYGGGGGCGGFEVFAFLAFLLALLDLLLDLNDMDDGGARHLRDVGSVHEGSQPHCSAELEVREAAWAAGQVVEGVLRAVTSPPACGHVHLCHAAAAAAARGPLAATFIRLAGEWLDRWPGLKGSQLGQVTLTAAATLTCPPDDHNCTADTPPTPSPESHTHPLHTQLPILLTTTPPTLDPPSPEGAPAVLQRYRGRRLRQRTDGKHQYATLDNFNSSMKNMRRKRASNHRSRTSGM